MRGQKRRLRIFYCLDENGESCMQLSGVLNQSEGGGYDVICVRDIRSALWWVQNDHFDLYILGREFSDGSGLELCRKLREFDADTPVVFYAEDAGDDERRLEGLAAGAQAYLVRPDVGELAVTVLHLLAEEGQAAA